MLYFQKRLYCRMGAPVRQFFQALVGHNLKRFFMVIASQVIVAFSDLLFVLSILSKKKANLLALLCFSDLTFALHYFLLQANSGAWVFIVDAAYLLVIYFLERYGKGKYNIYASIVSVGLVVILCLVSWQGWASILPMIAMSTSLICSCFKNVIIVKSGALTRNILNLVYMLVIPNKSLVGAILQGVLIVVSIVGIVQSAIELHKTKDMEKALN